jgi:hypothetical protein
MMNSTDKQQSTFSRNERRIFIILVILGILLIGFFGLRTVRSYIRLQRMGLKPGTTDVEAIRGWMTVPYIAAAYGVPEEYIFEQIGIPVEENQKKSLAQLNRKYAFGEKGVMVNTVKTAIKTYQEEHPSPSVPDHE